MLYLHGAYLLSLVATQRRGPNDTGCVTFYGEVCDDQVPPRAPQNLQVRPARAWVFSAGYGRDDPDDGDLAADGRSRNSVLFAVLEWRMTPNLRSGLEVSAWETGYRGRESQKTLRLQHAWVLTF